MRAVIHIGMHKTGSSSIQSYYHSFKHPDFVYAPFANSNHSGLIEHAFPDIDVLKSKPGFLLLDKKAQDRTLARRQGMLEELTKSLEECGDRTFLLSAEALCSPNSENAAIRFHEYISKHATDITIIGYARAPRSYALSAFQERSKVYKLTNYNSLWPNYRASFSKYDDMYGRENVIFREFNRDTLIGGDVVKDFAHTAQLPYEDIEKKSKNTSLSAEATSLLFTQRRLGSGMVTGVPGAYAKNTAFIQSLSNLGNRTFDFSEELWAPIAKARADDLHWMEERLGHKMTERKRKPDDIQISGDEDWFALAEQSLPELRRQICSEIMADTSVGRDEIVKQMDLLRMLAD